jgi:hypothetical protein
MTAYQCSCGYVAASGGELGDHWGEAFIPADDRDASGVVHAEAAREADGGPSWRCLCGDAFDHLGKLDSHLLDMFIPADHVGLDCRAHALAV